LAAAFLAGALAFLAAFLVAMSISSQTMTVGLSATAFHPERNNPAVSPVAKLGLECHTGCPRAAGEH
jgi:hypothetical protein